ncbi:hypothetical protein TRM7557_03866 [Tritonibacter multivorans]|uniref:Uncharacterized protein n=1 Tax=Tritonibacter multivorans TaxID=928856 RepID=A0A0P1GJK1_9RHOB|nr:hypothetical protein [Tritonibacter multivorans]MDA7421488.1 hypothetical protein [Tritonibacter multivorans]CUH82306.1 hypothetical protein TRM7557_03866 [Tritonibacter multivorans]SFC98220.1 hypothetical protein SAMN04488049_105212 [Tritonibacter multivorans]
METTPQPSFQDRVDRISASHKEAAEQRRLMLANLPKEEKVKVNKWWQAFTIAVAIAFGMVLLFVATSARMRLYGYSDESAMVLTLADVSGALALTWGFGQFQNNYNLKNKLAQAVGILLMAVGIHNLAFWFPETMSLAISGDWVRQQQVEAAPNSVLIGPKYIRLSKRDMEYGAPLNVTPKVIYRD